MPTSYIAKKNEVWNPSVMTERTSITCLLLCAGQSSRMAPHHKLLLSLGENSVLQSMMKEILDANFTSIVAVTGHHSEKIKSILSSYPINQVHNKDFEFGMHTSIQAGLRLLSSPGFVAVCLADQPLLKSSDYDQLIEAAQKNPQAKLIAPYWSGKRGNPVLISTSLKDEILREPHSDGGCSYLFQRYPDEVVRVNMNSDAILFDIDTPEDYQCLISTNL